MTDVRDAESAYLQSTARFKTWLMEFMNQWMRPYQDVMFVTMWESLPDPVKQNLKKSMPEEFAEVEKRYQAISGK
jgi:hypothetical protein